MTEQSIEVEGGGRIFIPDRDEKTGYPFVQVVLDCPPSALNIVGPDQEDVDLWAARLHDARRRWLAGDLDVEPIAFVEPMFGTRAYVYPETLGHVVTVTQGWTPKVAVQAMRRQLSGDTNRPMVVAAPADPFGLASKLVRS